MKEQLLEIGFKEDKLNSLYLEFSTQKFRLTQIKYENNVFFMAIWLTSNGYSGADTELPHIKTIEQVKNLINGLKGEAIKGVEN